MALTGILLWLALFWLAPEQISAVNAWWRAQRCAGRQFTGTFDDCFNDYIPILEVLFLPAGLILLAFPFAVMAFSFFADPGVDRNGYWKYTLGNDSKRGFPVRAMFALVGFGLCVWTWFSLPQLKGFVLFYIYWACFAAWFLLAASVRVHDWRRVRAIA